MIELKKAINIGKEFLFEVLDKPEELILDSANLLDEFWLIKFRVPLKVTPINSLQNVLGVNKRIFYKIVKIDEEGNVMGIIDEELPLYPKNSSIQTQTT